MADNCNPSTKESETGGAQLQDQSEFHKKSEARGR